MSDQKTNQPTPTLGAVLRELGRQFRTSFREGMERAHAAREAQAAVSDGEKPAPGLSAEEQARLERLLRSWSGPTGSDRPA